MLLTVSLRGAFAVFLALLWEGVRLLNGADWSWEAVGWRVFLVSVALYLTAWASSRRRRWFALIAFLLSICLVAFWWDLRQPYTFLAWFAAAGLYTLLLTFESAFFARTQNKRGRLAWLEYGIALLFLTAVGGVTPVLWAQIEGQFAEEEFFVAVQAVFLALFALLLLLAQILARRLHPVADARSFKLRPLCGMLVLLALGAGLFWWSVRTYQSSFYSPSAPGYDGVSADAPFLCASLPPTPGAPDGAGVFQRIQVLIEDNPRKGVPEYGMLALITDEQRWADAFREAILAEAEAARFTEPANSVKYGQRLAALRIYYFTRILKAFPGLFSEADLAVLSNWFAVINRRAMTVEWVDWLYALAFSIRPQGPYENQENGAGLLALLESADTSDGRLSALNRDYLARNARGWDQRFRNSDDAYLYQTEWIDNALFQDIYRESSPDPEAFARRRGLAFEWLLLQTLPGGAPLTYNRPGALSVANTLYLGALLLGDPRYVWATDQALTYLEASGGYLSAQPGLERPVEMAGAAPAQGTCLLFSPTGLPTQLGPLAPDKIVFRDGWTADASYLLLNLRFTGWHRYKGTNGIVLFHRNGPLVVEESTGRSFGWLPIGRSLFRDKRIPRENLNGLLIPRDGFSQVIFAFTGLNGPWAQDPPHHARVEDFSTMGLLDTSRTIIEDWRGWRHQRAIYFFHQGPVIVVDDALRPGGGQAALVWHFQGLGESTEAGLWLRRGEAPIRVALPSASWPTTTVESHSGQSTDGVWEMTYLAPKPGQLDLVTAFLMNGWEEAQLTVQTVNRSEKPVGQLVRLDRGDQQIHLLHNDQSGGRPITAEGLSTDGSALILFRDAADRPEKVCAVGGSQARLELSNEPRSLIMRGDQTGLRRGQDWTWEDGVLILWPASTGSVCLDIQY